MRRGEVCGLRWSDVDLEAGRVTIRQQLVMIAGGEGRAVRVQNYPKSDGSPSPTVSVSNAFTVRARRAGLKRIRFHDLRHTHCAHLIAADVNIRAISGRMGHASVSFTLDRFRCSGPVPAARLTAA